MNFLPFEDEYLRKTLFLKDCIIKIPITLKAQTVHLLFTDKTYIKQNHLSRICNKMKNKYTNLLEQFQNKIQKS